MARPLCTASEMRALDAYTIERVGVPGVCLMETAGRAVAAAVEAAIEGRSGGRGIRARTERARIAILAGGGNNGGDGAVCGRQLLARGGLNVELFLASPRAQVKGDARTHLDAYERAGGPITDLAAPGALDAAIPTIASAEVVVDALLGTGLSAPVRGQLGEILSRVGAAARGTRVAVDIPSGLCADTGQPLGPVIRADVTVTFGQLKRGLVCYPGVRLAGRVEVADIGIPGAAVEQQGIRSFLAEEGDLRDEWPRRTRDGHKGTFGHLLIIGGHVGMTGAVLLSAMGALRSGVGKVTVAVPAALLGIVEAAKPTEVMCVPIPDGTSSLAGLLEGKDAVVLGPGLGREPEGHALVARALAEVERPMLVDADGLYHLGSLLAELDRRQSPTVITPHPGEMAHLLRSSSSAVQANRIDLASRFSASHRVSVVLKGAGTVVSTSDGDNTIIPFGNPGMATAGTGDVLSGVIGALLAGGSAPYVSARLGAILHALAGDVARRSVGEAGMVASDLVQALPRVLRSIETAAPLDLS